MIIEWIGAAVLGTIAYGLYGDDAKKVISGTPEERQEVADKVVRATTKAASSIKSEVEKEAARRR